MIPGVDETPATIEAGFPWVRQTRALLAPSELQGLVDDLQPAVDDFAEFVDGQVKLLPVFDAVQPLPVRGRAAERRAGHPGRQPHHRHPELQGVLPVAGRARGRRPELHRQRRLHALPAGRRRQPGPDRPGPGDAGPRFGNATGAGGGTRPARGPKPPYKPNAACHTQRSADLNSAKIGPAGRAVRRQIKKQARVFAAIIVLFVVAIGIAGYILSNQRFYLPGVGPGHRHRLLRGRGRAVDRPGGRARPGPDGERRRREGRRGRRGQARERPRRRDDADQGRVQADLPGRHDPAAAQDRPQGHDPGARPGHRERPARSRRAAGSRSPTRCPT